MIGCILKSIGFYLVLLIVGTNLIGLFIRSLVYVFPLIDESIIKENSFLKKERKRIIFSNTFITIFSFILIGVCLFILFYFWNFGLALAFLIIISCRVPDLVLEIRTGKKISKGNHPNKIIVVISTFFLWGSMFLVWYSLCLWTK